MSGKARNYSYGIMPVDLVKNNNDLDFLSGISYIYYSMCVDNMKGENIVIPSKFIDFIGRKPRSGTGQINNRCVDAYNNYVSNYTTTDEELSNIGDIIYIDKLSIKNNDRFVKIKIDHVKKIFYDTEIFSSSMYKIRAFNLYTYLVSNMYSRGTEMYEGGVAEVCRMSYTDMAVKFNITNATVKKYVHQLFDLGILVSNLDNPVYHAVDGKRWRRGKTVYAVKKDGWEDELEQGIKQYCYALERLGNQTTVGNK